MAVYEALEGHIYFFILNVSVYLLCSVLIFLKVIWAIILPE